MRAEESDDAVPSVCPIEFGIGGQEAALTLEGVLGKGANFH